MKRRTQINRLWAGNHRRPVRRLAGCIAIGAALAQPASAINIDIEYSTDFGGDESPSWDSSGTILKAHFNAAVKIWEALLPGPGSYEFDFQWDDDISGLGLTTDAGFLDVFVEINPNQNWFADPTLNDDAEFTSGVQTLFQDLSGPNQSTYFPGTAPPGTLEVGFRGNAMSGFPSATGQPGINATNGFDLLSTVVHEIGHILGIGADPGGEPGEFNIDSQHVGGLTDVLVLEDDDSGHLAGDGIVPFLMCETCGAPGVRRFPTATDVLVIAEDQGISNVRLARVGSISSGLWGSTNRWIGGAVPNENQDVYISHGGTVNLNINAHVDDLRVDPGNSVDAMGNRLTVDGALTMNGATVSVGAGGTIEADSIVQGLGTFTTTAGSMVRFNNFTAGLSSIAGFNGSVGIGFDNPGPSVVTFDPTTITVWNIAEALRVGDAGTTTTFLIDNGMTVSSDSGRIGTDFNGGGEGIVQINGNNASWTMTGSLDGRNGLLSVLNQGQLETGSVALGDDAGEMRAGVDGNGSTWSVNGNVDIGPSTLTGSGQGGLTVQNNGLATVSGDLDVHGTSTVESFVVVQTNGTLDVAGDITIGLFGEVQLLGSTIRANKLLPFFGTFTWTNGTLDLTGQEVILDSALPPLPLASTTTLQNSQKLILNGAGRDLTVGESANGQLDLFNTASVQVNNGDVFIAKNAGSAGKVRLLGVDTSFLVDGSMAVGGDQAGPGGVGQLFVAGDLVVTDTLTYWPTASVQVDSTGVLSADVLRRGGGGGLSVNPNGRIRFNELQGFGANIATGGISMIGIAEGDTGQGALVRNTNQDYSFRGGWVVGDNAKAQVDLINGGRASGDGFVHMGNRPGSGGTVLNVSGVNGFGTPSQLLILNNETSDDLLIVGVQDVATLNVIAGGFVHSGGATIARDLSASGSKAIVNGQGSFWEVVQGDLVVGGGAQGQLTVENQGLVEIDGTLWIGGKPTERDPKDPDENGPRPSVPSQVLITGPASRGIAHFDTVVGFDLSGELIVEARGEMHTDFSGYIAFAPTSRGSSAVVSTRAGWKIDRDLFVGYEAKGSLEIKSEGNVTVAGSPTGGNATIATQATSGGSTVSVTDLGTWVIAKDLYVGNQAEGDLTIDTKGQVTVGGNATVGDQNTAGGSGVTVSTEGGWDVGGDLRVGRQAQGALQIDANGRVTVGNHATVGDQNTAGGSGATVSTEGVWDVGGDLRVGSQAQGALQIDTKGRVLVGNDATVGDQNTANGSAVTVLTEGVWDIGGDLRIGEHTRGSLSVDSRGGVLVGGDAYLGAGSSDGDGTITLSGRDDTQTTLDVTGILYVGGDSTGSIGRGVVDMEGQTRVRADRVWIRDDGHFDLAGVVDAPVGGVNNRGLFTGQGRVIGGFINRGVVAPGNSAGDIGVTSYAQSGDATFKVELGGVTAGTAYDRLVVDEQALLRGTLDVALIGGFTPAYGDVFEVLTYDTRSGVFDQVVGHILSPVLALGQFYDYQGTSTLTLLATAPGDANGDLIVDAFDFGLLAGNFNLPGTWETGDFDGDGTTDAFDFGLLAANFNGDFSGVAAAAAALGITTIPEPGTAVLLISLGVLGMAARRAAG